MTRRIGFTTSIPVEILFAAEVIPVDLNNFFVAQNDAFAAVESAERIGFSANTCAWVKGLYATAKRAKIDALIGVIAGDCSPNTALLDIFAAEKIPVIPFAYPATDHHDDFAVAIKTLAQTFAVSDSQIAAAKIKCDQIRARVKYLDDSAWQNLNVPSDLLFSAQLLTSDFLGDFALASRRLDQLFTGIETSAARKIPVAVVGVPAIIRDLWRLIENAGGRVVYHEMPQQFSRADFIGADLAETWRQFTYPAEAPRRLREIFSQCQKRGVRGIIHYTQAFCHRQIHEILMRRESPVPILAIEGDRPADVDGRTRTRIEAFFEQLSG